MRRIFMSSALALALTACGSGQEQAAGPTSERNEATTAAAAAKTDPCSLVTADEVGEIIGDKIVTTKPADGTCTYETADAQASSVTIELNQTDAAGQMDVAKRTAGVLKGMGAEAAEQGGAAGQDVNAMLSDSGDAPNVGDEAFFGANSQLSVRKGNSYIAIDPPIMRSRMASGSPLLSSDDKKKMALAIAEKAVARLP
jgi:hypothetical protein